MKMFKWQDFSMASVMKRDSLVLSSLSGHTKATLSDNGNELETLSQSSSLE